MFGPALPADHSPNSAAQMRGQLTGLKDISDALAAATITAVTVDAVNTVGSAQPANVTVSVVGNTLHLIFDIPQGPQGPSGDVTNSAMATAIAAAIDGTARNPSGIPPFAGSFSDPPTQAEMTAFAAYVESLRSALLR